MVHKIRGYKNENNKLILTDSDIEAIVDGLWSKGQAGGLSSDEFRVFYDLLKIHNERD